MLGVALDRKLKLIHQHVTTLQKCEFITLDSRQPSSRERSCSAPSGLEVTRSQGRSAYTNKEHRQHVEEAGMLAFHGSLWSHFSANTGTRHTPQSSGPHARRS